MSEASYGADEGTGNSLTSNERGVVDTLASAWNKFMDLPGQHCPDDVDAFRSAIHTAQQLIAFRVARRVDPNYWK